MRKGGIRISSPGTKIELDRKQDAHETTFVGSLPMTLKYDSLTMSSDEHRAILQSLLDETKTMPDIVLGSSAPGTRSKHRIPYKFWPTETDDVTLSSKTDDANLSSKSDDVNPSREFDDVDDDQEFCFEFETETTSTKRRPK